MNPHTMQSLVMREHVPTAPHPRRDRPPLRRVDVPPVDVSGTRQVGRSSVVR